MDKTGPRREVDPPEPISFRSFLSKEQLDRLDEGKTDRLAISICRKRHPTRPLGRLFIRKVTRKTQPTTIAEAEDASIVTTLLQTAREEMLTESCVCVGDSGTPLHVD